MWQPQEVPTWSIFLLPERLKALTEMLRMDQRKERGERRRGSRKEGTGVVRKRGERRGLDVEAVSEVDRGGLGFSWVEPRPTGQSRAIPQEVGGWF